MSIYPPSPKLDKAAAAWYNQIAITPRKGDVPVEPTLDILYAFDEKYAPFAGVSLFSLLESNRETEGLRVVLAVDRVSEENRRRFEETARDFGREVVFADVGALLPRIEAAGVPDYRGSLAANARLFWPDLLPNAAKRMLYLDCDTLVCASLAPLISFDLAGKTAGAVRDALTGRYKSLLDFPATEPYFNSGVLLIDTAHWRERQVSERIAAHAATVRADYPFPDQDLLNLVLRGNIAVLPPAYNFQPQHRAFSDKAYFSAYPREGYYETRELEDARRAPVILHAYRMIGDYPWNKGRIHPDAALWESIHARSPWRDGKPEPAKNGPVFAAERMLYRLLPKGAFLRLFAREHEKNARKRYRK